MAQNEGNEPTLGLLDIADINIVDVAELRFTNVPVMVGLFKIVDAKLELIGQNDKVGAVIECEVVEVEKSTGLVPPMVQSDLIGMKHREVFFFTVVEDVGRLKAFCVDIGVEMAPGETIRVRALLEGIKGITFPGRIKHRQDKNDKEITYSNVIPAVTKPGAGGQQAAA